MSNSIPYDSTDISFGFVPVGTTSVKSVSLRNDNENSVTYYITRNTQTNPIYHVFDVNKYEVTINPDEEFLLKVTYTPNIPGNRDFDYFNITNGRSYFQRLSMRGECIGPLVSCSIRFLHFCHSPKYKNLKKMFEIANTSNVPAIYQFDCDEENGVFSVSPQKGILAPQEHEFITVKFQPMERELYSQQLCCLILYHEPVIINLFGILSKEKDFDFKGINLRYFPFPFDETIGFGGFFNDSVTIKHAQPPFSLTVNYLDFGQIKAESLCQTLTTSLTNHLENSIEISWDSPKLFGIYPEKLEIPSKQSALFECRFTPEEKNSVAWVIMNGQVLWQCNTDLPPAFNIPIPLTLRMIGHSFPANESWIASVSVIPNNVILPLCLPGSSSWTTFMIQSHGHLPVLFKLLPPKRTNFIMKPMIGLIRKFQIIAVQLQTTSLEKQSFIEKWGIELNGQEQKSNQIYVKAQTDTPNIVISDKNCVKFEAIQPGTEVTVLIPIVNVSFCQLMYKFENLDNVEFIPDRGILSPNEEIFATVNYKSTLDDDGVIESEVVCKVQAIRAENVQIGETVQIPIKIITEVVYSELCALPQSCQHGDIECGSTIESCFYLYNFGNSNINFKLCHNFDRKNVTLEPECGKCGPKEKLRVRVKLALVTAGKKFLIISYNNRRNGGSDDVVEGEGAKPIFKLECVSVYPLLQISDILEHNLKGFFCKNDLWEMCRIDEINAALVETNPGEIKRIDLHIPDCEESDKLFYLIFAFKNTSRFYTEFILKRRQLCDCKQIEISEGLTMRRKTFDCPHRDMFTIEISSKNIPAFATVSLSFKIKYLLSGENTFSYIMELSNDRTIILNIYSETIAKDYFALSVFKQNYLLNMDYVYIGLKEAPVFAFWLYNNTSRAVPFKIDDLNIVKLCNEDGFSVLECMTCVGFLEAFSSAPVLFKFWPIEAKLYQVSVPLLLGFKETILTIQGHGTDQLNKFILKKMSPDSQSLKNNNVSLSIDNLIVEPLLMGNYTERMFFIKNHSKTNIVRYIWKESFLDGLIEITPQTVSGCLQPKESQPVIIKITSLHEPCNIRILLTLEFETKNETSEETFNLALPIRIFVVGNSDKDLCISVDYQFKQTPWDRTSVDVEKFVEEYFEKQLIRLKEENLKVDLIDQDLVQYVLEHIVGDAILSEHFLESVKLLKSAPSPLYSQIKSDFGDDRQKEVKAFLTRPQMSEVVNICEEMIIDSLRFNWDEK